jgi:FKBP-type peptidyl-prolyl cis-trans isomerase SlyD
MSPTCVENGVVVLVKYTLRNEKGVFLDRSDPGEPLPYLHGAGNIIRGLEQGMVGLAVGATKIITVPPEDGYGLRDGEPKTVPRSAFPEGQQLMPGMQFSAENPDGKMVDFWVVSVIQDQVVMEPNHPLAGETLVFEVEVEGLRAPTDEELAHGHPHGVTGADGHGHQH